jgi:hypothetical protein
MAKKTTHTHTGTCQACGAVQAVDNGTQMIAKHGYKVAGFGMFVGVCQGSDRKPAELDISFTHQIITNCQEWAANADRIAALLESRSLMVYMHEVDSGKRDAKYRRIYHSVMMFGCDEYEIGKQRGREIGAQESQAKNARAHADALVRCVIPRFGRPLYKAKVVKPPRQFKAGERVTLYGKAFIITNPSVPGYRAMYVKGHYEGAPDKTFTPSLRTLRGQNP